MVELIFENTIKQLCKDSGIDSLDKEDLEIYSEALKTFLNNMIIQIKDNIKFK